MQLKKGNATANQTKLRCTKHPPHPTHSLSEHRQRHIASIAALRPAFCFISDPHDGSIVSAPYFFHRSDFFFTHYRQRSLGAYDGDDADACRRPLRVILFFTTQRRTYFTLSLLFFFLPDIVTNVLSKLHPHFVSCFTLFSIFTEFTLFL